MFENLNIENSLKIVICLFAYLLICLFIAPPAPAQASSFITSYLRLNSQQANSPLSGTVCAQPSSGTAGNEAYVAVTFPAGFTISQNPSNWNSDSSQIPPGSAAWPKIAPPVNGVSGQTVTFMSGHLTSGSLYCFNFTGSASTTGNAADNQTGTVKTENSSYNVIDSSTFATSIINNDAISVTAGVNPNIQNMAINFRSTTPGNQFPQNTTLSYIITYGSVGIQSPIPLTIQAQWSQGTVNGSPGPSVDILNYVVGSATNAYGNTPAVVDTINRTITWTIPSFPAHNPNETVTFSLQTNGSYTGTNNVSFTVSTRAISNTTVTPDQTVTQNYLYSTPLPTTAPTPTPSPLPTPQPLYFSDIFIQSLTQSQAQIQVTTTNNSTLSVGYGTSMDRFSDSITTLIPQKQTTVTLTNLAPNTNYYFQIIAKDINGNTVKSDIFTFTTAVISKTPAINLNSLTTTSNGNILLNSNIRNSLGLPIPDQNVVTVPESSVFEIQFSLSQNTPVKSIQAIIRNKYVLGLNTFNSQTGADSNYVDLIEISPGVYTGRIESMPQAGFYEIFIKIADYNGNITEQKLADLTVTNKFTVLEKGTNNPVENARVLLYLYDPDTKIYRIISPQILSIGNPSFSLNDGTIDTVFPYGQYKADISAIGYAPQTIEFNINPQSNSYPTVHLQKEPFNILDTVEYYGNTFTDAVSATQSYLIAHAASSRLFDLLTGTGLLFFVFITLLAFSAKTHIPLLSLPYFFVYKIKLLNPKTKSSVILGRITDSKNKSSVSQANVYIIDAQANRILTHLRTNRLGEFYFKKPGNSEFKISVMKKGYEPSPFFEYNRENITAKPLSLQIERSEGYIKSSLELIFSYSEELLGILFGFILIASLIVQVFFIYTFGFLRIAPFLVISTLNIILLLLFLYKPKPSS